jgi:hypothetical protein
LATIFGMCWSRWLLCQLTKRFVIITASSRYRFPVSPNVLADITLSVPDQACWMTSHVLEQALRERHPPPSLLYHSDRGARYASHEYSGQPEAIGAHVSMPAGENPYDTAKSRKLL